MPPTVLLLRAPPEDGTPDKYESAFTTRGYRARSLAVLETVHTNASQLASILRAGGAGYAGVVVTSARACEAWRAAVESVEAAEGSGSSESDWSTVPFYAIGEATASALRAIHTLSPHSPHAPRDVRGGGGGGGAESGTSEKLARFVVADLGGGAAGARLLYLTGDKNRDTLAAVVREAGVALESVQVYATQGSSRFEEDLRVALEDLGGSGAEGDPERQWWIVHFAPSSAKHVSPILDKFFNVSGTVTEELGMEVHVVAAKPTPEALAEGIATWDHDHLSTTEAVR